MQSERYRDVDKVTNKLRTSKSKSPRNISKITYKSKWLRQVPGRVEGYW